MKLLAIALASCASSLGVLAWATSPESPRAAGASLARADAQAESKLSETPAPDDDGPRADHRLEAPPPRVEGVVATAAMPSVDPAMYDVLWPRWPQPQPYVDALATARSYFHASEELARLDRDLPVDLDPALRTPQNYPDYFAALGERDRLVAPFLAIPPPSPDEPLPALNLWSHGDAIAAEYARWSREDLLVEQWRIARAAYAESKRVLDLRLERGPYETVRRDASTAFG